MTTALDEDKDNIKEILLTLVDEEKPGSVEDLINLVNKKHSFYKDKIIDAINALTKEGRIILKAPKLSINLLNYLKTWGALWYWFVVIVSFATLFSVFTIPVDAYPFIYMRQFFGVLYTLCLPGYSLLKALFPTSKEDHSLPSIERIALSVGVSMALAPMIGLLLNFTPFGLNLLSITLSLLLITLIFATIGLSREHRYLARTA